MWDCDGAPPSPAWLLRGARDPAPAIRAGHATRGLVASYLHLPLAQRPEIAANLVARMRAIETRRGGGSPQTSEAAAWAM
jgi:cobyrinic acid a,c-diamide synthase